MEAKELRIGNFVNRRGGVYTVKGLKEQNLELYFTSGHYLSYVEYSEINPTPLTEEWLLKLGFEICNKGPEISATIGINPITYDYVLRLFNLENGWQYQNSFHKINYVHQLQNLYHALTGEELEIKEQ